jgi:hypothetical protein
MQSIKLVMRQIGVPNPETDIVSVQEVEYYLDTEFLANGYDVKNEHYLGSVKDASGNDVGYKVLFVLVKNETPEKAELKTEVKKTAKK